MKKALSLLFPLSLLALIAVVMARRYGDFALHQKAVVVTYVLWILYELSIAKRDYGERDSAKSDGITRELYASAHGLTILSALALGRTSASGAMTVVGLLVFAVGLMLRVCSSLTLGRFYSHNARLVEDHQLITLGPYRILRHPAYSGMLVIHIGVALLYVNAVTFAVLCGLLLPAIVYRILLEERLLITIPAYREHFGRKRRLLPFVW